MKHQILKIILTAGFAALLGTSAAFAQNHTEVADVPFTFHAAHLTLAPGTYTVTHDPSTGLIGLTNAAGHYIYIPMHPGKACNPNQLQLTFFHLGDNYVLTGLSMPDSNSAWVTFPSATEKVMMGKLAVATTVSIPLKSR
jgi:hypothetical protein